MKKLYIIAGPNGAGKTTASYTILSEIFDCKEFVNADEIAQGAYEKTITRNKKIWDSLKQQYYGN